MNAARTPVIVGVGLSDCLIALHLAAIQHYAQAARWALGDRGLPKEELHGHPYAGSSGWGTSNIPPFIAEYARIDCRVMDGTFSGGSSPEIYLQHASAAIQTVVCDSVLVHLRPRSTRQHRQCHGRGLGRSSGRAAPDGGSVRAIRRRDLRARRSPAHALTRQLYSVQADLMAIAGRPDSSHPTILTSATAVRPPSITCWRRSWRPTRCASSDTYHVTDASRAFVVTTAVRARNLRNTPVLSQTSAMDETHLRAISAPGPDWVETAGRKTISTSIVICQIKPLPPGQEAPYLVAVVDLAEGVSMLGTVIGVEPDAIAVSQAVEAYAPVYGEGQELPLWQSAERAPQW